LTVIGLLDAESDKADIKLPKPKPFKETINAISYQENIDMEKATFAAGCFWHIQDIFSRIEGVIETSAGYTGGLTNNPSYSDVCSGITGHAEAVEVTYDPSKISYSKLLEIFWVIHDPTTLNRQGPDIGSQYRSVVFFHNPEQERLARQSIEQLNDSGRFKRPIVTEIAPASTFFKAEEYHQHYIKKKGLPSCGIK
jgi:peptide-methionine (S)-S-oxide reductase